MKTNRFSFLAVLAGFSASLAFAGSDASAITTLKQVLVSNGSQIDLLFDGKVSRSQIKTEFFNDIIQISLSNVSVYPAKISSVSGGPLTKIFAYQYAPKLVRARFSVKGRAESYKDQLVISTAGPGGKMLTIRIGEQSAATPSVAGSQTSAAVRDDALEQALLEKVLKNSGPSQRPAVALQQAAEGRPEKRAPLAGETIDRISERTAAPLAVHVDSPNSESSENLPVFNHSASRNLTSAKNLPSPLAAFGKLAFVIGLFSLIALGAKKFLKNGKGEGDRAIVGALGRFARKNLGSRAKMIEVVANHHLGPKRSIAVVKIGGRTLVVGITEQSINLIAQLSSDEDTMNALAEFDNPPLDEAVKSTLATGGGATVAGPAVFSKIFQTETSKPQTTTAARLPETRHSVKDVRVTSYGSGAGGFTGRGTNPGVDATMASAHQAAQGLSGVRAQIKSKLEGLKQI